MSASNAAGTRRVDPATVALGGLMLAAALLLLYAARHLTFFFDEWNFILARRGSDLGTYLDPHNGHLSLVPVVVYKLLLALVGLHHYTPYVVVLVALHLLCATLLYVLVRRRLGAWLALVPVTLLLFMGTAYQDLLWPFQIGFLSSVAGGLAALALIERREARADAYAALTLVLSLASSGVGISFLLACGVALVMQRSPWRRLWVLAVPAALFALWYIGWGGGEHATTDSVLAAPGFVANAATGTFAGIAGLNESDGPALTVAALALIAIAWRRKGGPPTPMLFAATAGAFAFWGLTAIARADSAQPAASRYLYVGAVFIFLIAAEAGVGAALRGGWFALAGIALAGALIGNIGWLRSNERNLRRADASVRASLAVLEVASPVVAPAFQPEPDNGPQIVAGPYLAAVRDLGSPALTLSELERASESTRANSDGVLERAEAIAPASSATNLSGTRPIVAERVTGARVLAHGPCIRLAPSAASATTDLRVSPGATILLHADRGPGGAVYLRRLAADFGPHPFAALPGGAAISLRFPLDRAPLLPWRVRVVAPGPVEVCQR